ncbi:MAG: DUF2974 domain-containing protein [Oscillospiraceae bacterium]|nr:DUF2974 domain-containing protein [Oscillospiraceae bacterium]
MSVSYDASAAFSALMYALSGNGGMRLGGRTLSAILNDKSFKFIDPISGKDRVSELRIIIEANGFGNVKIAGTSFPDKGYGTMYAATFQYPDGTIYVAYRGTGDGNWGYNADSAYGNGSSDMQEWALKYFEKTVGAHHREGNKLYVTGHSQGGNNAMYAALFSIYGGRIISCISIDGPGFNQATIDAAKRLWGDAYYESQRQKILGVYGENDYVHQQGEVHPEFAHFFVETNDNGNFADMHDIFSHISNGKLNNGPEDGIKEGPTSSLMSELINNLLENYPPEQRHEIAKVVMDIIEMKIGNGEGSSSLLDILAVIKELYPTLLDTIKDNPDTLFDVMRELGVDKMITDFVGEHPFIASALVLCLPFILDFLNDPDAVIRLIELIEAGIHFIEKCKEIAKNIKDFFVGCFKAIKNAVTKIVEWLLKISKGNKYAANNPYFKADTTKLSEYATRIGSLNTRLRRLDGALRLAFREVSPLDMRKFVWINFLTSGSSTLGKVQTYLSDAADRFATAESKANENMGG